MRCNNPNCNHEIPDDSVFCPDCGTQIVHSATPRLDTSQRSSNCDLNKSLFELFFLPMKFATVSIMPFDRIPFEDAYALYKHLYGAYMETNDDTVSRIIGLKGPLFQDSRCFLRHSSLILRVFSHIEFFVWKPADHSDETLDKWFLYHEGNASEAQMRRDLYGIRKSFYIYGQTAQLKTLLKDIIQADVMQQFKLEMKTEATYSSKDSAYLPIRIALASTEEYNRSQLIIYLNER